MKWPFRNRAGRSGTTGEGRCRLRIRLTVRGWLVASGLLLTTSFAVAKANNFMLLIASVLSSLLILGVLIPVWVGLGVRVRRLLPTTATAGDPLVYSIRLLRFGRGPTGGCIEVRDPVASNGAVEVSPSWSASVSTTDTPRCDRGITLSVTPAQRGWIRWSVIELGCFIPPKLWVARFIHDCPDRVLVHPAPLFLRSIPVPAAARDAWNDSDATGLIGSWENEEFFGLRDFRPGDSLRYVHWKSAARHPDRWFVREFRPEQRRRVRIVLDTFLGEDTERRRIQLERNIRITVGLTDQFLADQYAVRVQAAGSDPGVLDPRGGTRAALLDMLALLEPAETGSVSSLLEAAPPMPGEGTVLLSLTDHHGHAFPGASGLCVLTPERLNRELVSEAPAGTLFAGGLR